MKRRDDLMKMLKENEEILKKIKPAYLDPSYKEIDGPHGWGDVYSNGKFYRKKEEVVFVNDGPDVSILNCEFINTPTDTVYIRYIGPPIHSQVYYIKKTGFIKRLIKKWRKNNE